MVSGSPAFDHKQWLRAVNAFAKLPDLVRALRKVRQDSPPRMAGDLDE
jgi:hypothetical protein